MEHCERLVIDAAKSGGTPWPPTYGEFIGYCEPKEKSSEPAAYKKFDRIGLPEPEEYRSKRQKKGREHCKRLMGMFDE